MKIHNRRSFLKANSVIGLGAIASGLGVTQSCSGSQNTADPGNISGDNLLAKYQECLGGPFPEENPLNPVLRETTKKVVGPLDPRLKCVIGNCCLPTYDAIEDKHILHCFPNFVPGWKQYGDTPDIASLIAPRALHLNFGENDTGSPIEFVKTGVKSIAQAYEKAGAPDNFSFYIEPGAEHVLSETMWNHAKSCFAKHLKTT